MVFSFSQCCDAVLNLVAGFLHTNGHFDVVQTHYQNLDKRLLVLGTFFRLPFVNLLGFGEKLSQSEYRKGGFILTCGLLADSR